MGTPEKTPKRQQNKAHTVYKGTPVKTPNTRNTHMHLNKFARQINKTPGQGPWTRDSLKTSKKPREIGKNGIRTWNTIYNQNRHNVNINC